MKVRISVSLMSHYESEVELTEAEYAQLLLDVELAEREPECVCLDALYTDTYGGPYDWDLEAVDVAVIDESEAAL